ncbi:hypothetical protein WJX81_002929 [Elliptochloris bilobata]|uniref:Amine oxidase n=1 Tax=Elliptochloris bilobata TaxID=381761 RepID=A0AAW1QNF3_9CHLO
MAVVARSIQLSACGAVANPCDTRGQLPAPQTQIQGPLGARTSTSAYGSGAGLLGSYPTGQSSFGLWHAVRDLAVWKVKKHWKEVTGGAEAGGPDMATVRRVLSIWRTLSYVLILACISLVIALAIVAGDRKALQRESVRLNNATAYAEAHTCALFVEPGQATLQSDRRPASTQPNLFEELSDAELIAVREYLFAQPELNLTNADNAGMASNTLFMVELLPPPKADALAALDAGAPLPPRQARATVYVGAEQPPRVAELAVGPLPTPHNHSFLRAVAWELRPPNRMEYSLMDKVVDAAAAQLAPLLNASFGGFEYHNCTPPLCLFWADSAPRGHAAGQRQTWIWFMRFLDGFYLHPVGLELLVDHSASDPGQWAVIGAFYGGQLFPNASALLSAWQNPGSSHLTRVQAVTPVPEDLGYSSLNRTAGSMRPAARNGAAPQAGPRQYQPAGQRFRIDRNAVDWLGWSFQVGSRPASGLRAWDVRFGGERIVYELALQEALGSLSGATPSQSLAQQYDSAGGGLGAGMHELVAGVDCPHTAAFLDMATLFDSTGPITRPRSLCVFELATGTPLRRHYTQEFAPHGEQVGYSGTPGSALVVRGIATAFATDYITDVTFYPNGAIEVSVTLSGYTLAAPYTPAAVNFSAPVFYGVGAPLRDHFLHWRVDLDVNGTANSVRLDTVELGQSAWPWSVPAPGAPTNATAATPTKRLRRATPETEDGASVPHGAAATTAFAVVNERRLNRWGDPRGYRIQVDATIPQLYPESYAPAAAAPWSRLALAASVRRDDEPSSSSIYAAAQPPAALAAANFSAFVNGEPLRGQDVVAWVTLGAWDLPSAESAPALATPGRRLGFWLQPYGYFDGDASGDLADSVSIFPSRSGRGATPVVTPGSATQDFQCVPPDPHVPYSAAELQAL